MSPELSTFLADWHNWATTGAPEGDVYKGGFSRRFGLCFHARKRSHHLSDELEELFCEEFASHADTPFEAPGFDYFEEGTDGRMHENPKRLAWVRQKLVSEL